MFINPRWWKWWLNILNKTATNASPTEVGKVINKLPDEFLGKENVVSAQSLSTMIILALTILYLSDHHIVGCLDSIM